MTTEAHLSKVVFHARPPTTGTRWACDAVAIRTSPRGKIPRMSQVPRLTVDELIRECGDLRWIYHLRNQDSLRTESGQPINEAKVTARGREFMSRDADPRQGLQCGDERLGHGARDESVSRLKQHQPAHPTRCEHHQRVPVVLG